MSASGAGICAQTQWRSTRRPSIDVVRVRHALELGELEPPHPAAAIHDADEYDLGEMRFDRCLHGAIIAPRRVRPLAALAESPLKGLRLQPQQCPRRQFGLRLLVADSHWQFPKIRESLTPIRPPRRTGLTSSDLYRGGAGPRLRARAVRDRAAEALIDRQPLRACRESSCARCRPGSGRPKVTLASPSRHRRQLPSYGRRSLPKPMTGRPKSAPPSHPHHDRAAIDALWQGKRPTSSTTPPS